MKWSLLMSLLLLLPSNTHGLFFYLKRIEQKCFIEELPMDTMVVGNYKTLHQTETDGPDREQPAVSILITVHDVATKHRFLNQVGAHKGRFVFTSSASGDYLICFQVDPLTVANIQRTKMTLEFLIGEHGADIAAPEDERVSSLVTKARDLNSKVADIRREQNLMRDREAIFRDQSERTNSRVVWWTILQLIILGVTCLWQMTTLKSFFQAKKLV